MSDISYKIEFHSNWHIGSGLSGNSYADLLVLKNNDHLVSEGIYVTGTLAGWRSQVAIAAGSGAAVATDILTLWNGGIQTHAHDSIRK